MIIRANEASVRPRRLWLRIAVVLGSVAIAGSVFLFGLSFFPVLSTAPFPGQGTPLHQVLAQTPLNGALQSLSRNDDTSIMFARNQNVRAREEPHAKLTDVVRLVAKVSRLEAERSGSPRIFFPIGFESAGYFAQHAATAERRLFDARRAAARNQKDQLGQRIRQLGHERAGLAMRHKAKVRELDVVRKELGLVEGLHRRQLTNETRLFGLQREAARFEGDIASLEAEIAKLDAQIAEVTLQIVGIDRAAALEAEKELHAAAFELSQLVEEDLVGGQSSHDLRPIGQTNNVRPAADLDLPAKIPPRRVMRRERSDERKPHNSRATKASLYKTASSLDQAMARLLTLRF